MASPLNIPVLGCVGAGVRRFGADLGDLAEGIVGPSQWEETLEIAPELGTTPAQFARRMRAAGSGDPDYPAAQSYAAGLLTAAAIADAGELRSGADSRRVFRSSHHHALGDFAIDRVTGRQTGHAMLLVQWHGGRKVIIDPEAHADSRHARISAGMAAIARGRRNDQAEPERWRG